MSLFEDMSMLKGLLEDALEEQFETGITLDDDEEVTVEYITSKYCRLVAFVLEKMELNQFDELTFRLNEYDEIQTYVVTDGKEREVDFDCYIEHDEEEETEIRMELENIITMVSAEELLDALNNVDREQFL